MGCKLMINAFKSGRFLGFVKIGWVMGTYECLKVFLLQEPLILRMEKNFARDVLDIGHRTTWLELRLSMSLILWVLFRFQHWLDVAKPVGLG